MLDPLLQVRGDPENVFDLVRTEVFEREKAAVLQSHRTLSGRADAGDTTPTQSIMLNIHYVYQLCFPPKQSLLRLILMKTSGVSRARVLCR